MKNYFYILTGILLLMSSCYTSTINHGRVNENTPMVKVASKKNPIMLWGLLPLSGANQKASDILKNNPNYRTKNSWTFIDGFLNFLTLGIYTPTTTTYYLPYNSNRYRVRKTRVNKPVQKRYYQEEDIYEEDYY